MGIARNAYMVHLVGKNLFGGRGSIVGHCTWMIYTKVCSNAPSHSMELLNMSVLVNSIINYYFCPLIFVFVHKYNPLFKLQHTLIIFFHRYPYLILLLILKVQ